MTARVPSGARNTRLTLSEGEVASEEAWRDARTDALEERRRVIMRGGYVWPESYRIERAPVRITTSVENGVEMIPRHIDPYRVAAWVGVILLSLAVVLGVGAILVYVLTAF